MRLSRQEILRRQNQVKEILQKNGADALVVEGSCAIDQRGWMRYLMDYYVPVFSEYLIIPKDGPVTFFAKNPTNGKGVEEKGLADQILLIPGSDGISPGKCVADVLKTRNVTKVAYCGTMTAPFAHTMKAELESVEFLNLTWEIECLRSRKSEEELILCREAIKLNEDIFQEFLKGVRSGNREMDAVANAAGYAVKIRCEDQFWLVGSGDVPRTRSLPLAEEQNHTWKEGDLCSVVIEIAGPGGYYGEVTHLLSVGKASDDVRTAYAVLHRARRAAEAQLRPGQPISAAAQTVSEKLMEAGYWKEPFTGIMGHGQGLDMSEAPMVSVGNSMILEAGMRINLHPTLVLESGIGVTACDCYEITADGCVRLTQLPDDLIEL